MDLARPARRLLAFRQRRALRRAADELLRSGAQGHRYSALLDRRGAELTSPRHRRTAARSLESIVDELDGRFLPSAVPLNRVAARPHVDLIRILAERVGDVERPVSAQGVALVDQLLTDGVGSPLYARERASELRAALERCLAALDSVD